MKNGEKVEKRGTHSIHPLASPEPLRFVLDRFNLCPACPFVWSFTELPLPFSLEPEATVGLWASLSFWR